MKKTVLALLVLSTSAFAGSTVNLTAGSQIDIGGVTVTCGATSDVINRFFECSAERCYSNMDSNSSFWCERAGWMTSTFQGNTLKESREKITHGDRMYRSLSCDLVTVRESGSTKTHIDDPYNDSLWP